MPEPWNLRNAVRKLSSLPKGLSRRHFRPFNSQAILRSRAFASILSGELREKPSGTRTAEILRRLSCRIGRSGPPLGFQKRYAVTL